MDRPLIEDLDSLPFVVEVYRRDLDINKYDIPFLHHPYLSLYTSRGCPALCTFCLWPQTMCSHRWRTRSSDNVVAEVRRARELFPQVKEIFFDDDTMTLKEILAEIAMLIGERPPKFRLPHNLVLPIAYMSETWSHLTHGGEPRVTVIGVRLAKKRMFFSTDKARHLLGFNPLPIEKGLREAVDWFNENGYIH